MNDRHSPKPLDAGPSWNFNPAYAPYRPGIHSDMRMTEPNNDTLTDKDYRPFGERPTTEHQPPILPAWLVQKIEYNLAGFAKHLEPDEKGRCLQNMLPGFAVDAVGRRIRNRKRGSRTSLPLTWAGDESTAHERPPRQVRGDLRSHHGPKDIPWDDKNDRWISAQAHTSISRPTEALVGDLIDAGLSTDILY